MEWTASGSLQKPAVKWVQPSVNYAQCDINKEWTVQKHIIEKHTYLHLILQLYMCVELHALK